MKEIDFDVLKFYAGEEGRMGGSGYGVWYIASDHTLHHLSGFNWDVKLEEVSHYQFADINDFWRLSPEVGIMFCADNSFYMLRTGGKVTPLELSVPDGGVSGIAAVLQFVNAAEEDGPILPTCEYLAIDRSGKLIQQLIG